MIFLSCVMLPGFTGFSRPFIFVFHLVQLNWNGFLVAFCHRIWNWRRARSRNTRRRRRCLRFSFEGVGLALENRTRGKPSGKPTAFVCREGSALFLFFCFFSIRFNIDIDKCGGGMLITSVWFRWAIKSKNVLHTVRGRRWFSPVMEKATNEPGKWFFQIKEKISIFFFTTGLIKRYPRTRISLIRLLAVSFFFKKSESIRQVSWFGPLHPFTFKSTVGDQWLNYFHLTFEMVALVFLPPDFDHWRSFFFPRTESEGCCGTSRFFSFYTRLTNRWWT